MPTDNDAWRRKVGFSAVNPVQGTVPAQLDNIFAYLESHMQTNGNYCSHFLSLCFSFSLSLFLFFFTLCFTDIIMSDEQEIIIYKTQFTIGIMVLSGKVSASLMK